MSNARVGSRVLKVFALFAGLLLIRFANAQGPGLPNLTYTSAELFKPLSIITSQAGSSARGQGGVAMHDGYLLVIYAPDSGRAGGGFSFYNISNPRSPSLVSKRDVSAIREPHGFGFSNSYPGHYAVVQTIRGIQFWDWTNVNSPVMLNDMTLPGIQESDYDQGAWWAFWQAPYVYVGGSGNGLYVVDATNPSAPTLVRQVPTSTWGGFRVGPTFAVGNILVMSSMDRAGMVTMDISDPANPQLLRSVSTGPAIYSATVNGDRIIAAGGDGFLYVYNISDPTQMPQTLKSAQMGGKGGYVSVQDGFAHVGASANYAKVNLSTGAIAGTGTSGISGRDEDFATVLGNLVLIGNDHSEGSALVPHSTARDTTGPSVNMVSPRNNSTNQSVKSRVGITLTDSVDLRTVSSSTFIVRPLGGSALPGKYSSQTGIVNFWPDQQFLPGTIYEVVVTAGGIKDWANNGVPTQFTSRFTTAGTAPGLACTLNARPPSPVNTTASFSPGSVSGGGTIRYAWDFGDGATTPLSTSPNATHAYSATAHYAVKLTVDNGTQSATCSATQTVHTQPTANPPKSSSTIAFDATRNRVWVVNSDTNTVTAINGANNTKAFEAAVGNNPQTVAQAPDGRIWVANMGSSTISVLNPDTGAVAQTITLPAGSRPFGVVFAPDNAAAYVTLQGTGRLLEVNPTSGAQLANLSVGPWPRGIAVTADSSRVLITRFISPASRGEVVEVNPETFVVTRTFALANDPGPDTESSGRGIPNYMSNVAIQPDGRRAWIPSKKDNTSRGTFRDGNALTFESTVRTIVSQIDLTSNAEVLSARVDLNDRDMANAVLFTPLGDYAFVSTQGTNAIEVLDVYNRQIVTGIVNTGRAPRGMVLGANGRLYVQNFMSRTVSVYDVSGLLNATSTNVPKVADVSAVATELLAANVLTGKRIFYNADDARMNRDKYISCASCHQDGGQDGRVMDFTDRGEGLRNTVALTGRRGVGQGRVHWTGNFDEIQDFENDIRNAFGGTGFLSNAQFNTGTRANPLGDPKAGLNADLDALAAYVTSLNSVGRSPFRNADGSMTADAVAGKTLFDGVAGCVTCHSGTDFTDSATNVLHNVGTIKPSSGKRIGGTLTGFDTPTLRGVWETAPYLHDGSAATLMDVLTTQNIANQHGTTSGLTTTQLNQLVAYLQQIDDSGASPTLAISNMSVKDTANAADWSIRTNLQTNDQSHGDRTFTFSTVPSLVAGAQWIRTANDSKAYTGNPLVTFDINTAADVYVAMDDRIARPAWVDATWTDTGSEVIVRESSTTTRPFSLYRKRFNAGQVSLGPWNNSGSTNYSIIVK
jgi:YVTN family beta-propeller protein